MKMINNLVEKKINRLSAFITFKLNKKKNFGYIERAKIKYAFEVISYDLLKFIILISLFLLVGRVGAFFVIYLTLMTTRVQIGGMHMKTFVTCFLYTTFFFIMVIIVADLLLVKEVLLYVAIAIEMFLFINKNILEAKRNRDMRIVFKPMLSFVIFIVLTMVLAPSLMKYIAIALIYHQIEIFCVYIHKRCTKDTIIGSSED